MAALVAFSAFFSASETSFTSVNMIRIRNMAEEGDQKAVTAVKLVENYDRMLSTILIGNNLVNIALSSLTTVIATKLFGDAGVALATGVTTLVILTFGEILPKSWAKENSERLVLLFAEPLRLCSLLLWPLSTFFIWLKGAFRRGGEEEKAPSFTEKELMSYGGKNVSISFNEATDLVQTNYDNPNKAEALAEMINKKLADQKITLSNGETVSASECIAVKVDTNPNGSGTISFEDKRNAGNSVYISSASSSIKDTFGLGELKDPKENQVKSFHISSGTDLTKTMNTAEYLSGKSMNISLDGSSKSIKLPEIVKKDDGTYKIKNGTDASGKDIELDFNAKNYTDVLNASLKKAFGGKVSVENLAADDAKPDSMELQLKFNAPENSNLIINADAGEKLGIGTVATNYLNTSKTLEDLLSDHKWETMKD